MMWILLSVLVGVVVWAVRDQLQREKDASCMTMLVRESLL